MFYWLVSCTIQRIQFIVLPNRESARGIGTSQRAEQAAALFREYTSVSQSLSLICLKMDLQLQHIFV